MKLQWMGQTYCDFCRIDVRSLPVFYDAKTVYGPWAVMCQDCILEHGTGKLGIGYGQCYSGKTLLKIAG